VLTLCCFLMPFFNTSCNDESFEEKKQKETEMAEKDTVVTSDENKTENILQESFKNSLAISEDSTKSKEKKEDFISSAISEKVPVLKPVLNPSEDVYSGIGTILDAFPWIRLFGTPICFLLLIIGLVAKYIDKSAKTIVVFLNILSLAFLLIAQSMSWHCEKLWGLWITVTFISILTIYDIYIARLFHLLNKQPTADTST
jgi:hypothetical protein